MAYKEVTQLKHKVLSFKDLDINNLVLIGSYHCKNSRKKVDPHIHKDTLEIIYFNSGYQTYYVEDKTYYLKGGDVLVILPNEIHGTGNNFQGKGIIYWIQFNLSLVNGSFLNFQKKDASVFIETILNLPTRQFSINNSFKKILDDLIEMGTKEITPFKKIKIYSIATQILLEIEKFSNSKGAESPTKDIAKIVKYINDNLSEDLFIEDLAKKLNLSISRFINKLKNELGTTPSDFIQRQRIEKSKHFIQNTSLSFTEIAFKLHFPSSQHFSTIFKKYTGVTPSSFRKSHPD